jgi:hypothetical protein
MFFGVHAGTSERIGLLVYPFRMTTRTTHNRPEDEARGQIRYGSESSWLQGPHHIGHDVAGVDITLVLGVHLDEGVLVGLDPYLYDPLPMGISFYAKVATLRRAARDGWQVWERQTMAGSVRTTARTEGTLETLVAFTPDRLLDYARLEREAADLGLDQPLRFAAARRAGERAGGRPGIAVSHALETAFELSSAEILEIIATRNRLSVAVRGGVAEHHLGRRLASDPHVARVVPIDRDGEPDFEVTLADGRSVRVECKNASPERYADGTCKVEVQKTRVSKSDPASRAYRVDQFDVLAACMYAPTGRWAFCYRRTGLLTPHAEHAGRVAAIQRIDDSWSASLLEALT